MKRVSQTAPVPDPGAGLCSVCRHASVQQSERGSRFWRCRAADRDAGLARYPALPVRRCARFEEARPDPPG